MTSARAGNARDEPGYCVAANPFPEQVQRVDPGTANNRQCAEYRIETGRQVPCKCPKRLPRDRIILYSSRFSVGTAQQSGASRRLDPRRLSTGAALVPSLESNPVADAAQVLSEHRSNQGKLSLRQGMVVEVILHKIAGSRLADRDDY